jgi:hypothetical protein
VWNWVIIAACYGFAACFLRLIGGFNSAGDALARWGRRTSERRVEKSGESPASYARSRLNR